MLERCLLLAVLVEAVWESVKLLWEKGRFNTNQFGAMCIALLFSLATDTRLLEAVGITVAIPLLDRICTGLLMSRGSNFVHTLFDWVKNKTKA